MENLNIVRMVNGHKVLFTTGLTIDGYEGGEFPVVNTGGFYQLDKSQHNWDCDTERQCQKLYRMLIQCHTIVNIGYSRNYDYGSLTDSALDDLIKSTKECTHQTDWKVYDQFHNYYAILYINLTAEKACRNGYQLTQSPLYGYVYLVKASTGHYKIGRSVNPEKRVTEFVDSKVILPIEFELEHTIETDDYFKLEKLLHHTFSSSHVKGEWFDLDKHQTRQIKTIRKVVVDEALKLIA